MIAFIGVLMSCDIPGKELAFGMVGLFGGNERHTQRSLLALLFLNVFGAKEEHPPYGVKKIRP